MSVNAAITAKDNLKKAIKAGKTECGAIAANIDKIISEGLLEFLDLPSDNPADRLHDLITLPLNKGGLNCEVRHVDALLTLNFSVQRKFRDLIYASKQGQRNDLKEDKKDKPKVNAKVSPPKKKLKGELSDSQKASDRAASRAAKVVPELDELLDEGLVAKQTAAKLGRVIKNPDNPTEKDREILQQQQEVAKKLKEIVPNPLPEEASKRKKIQKQVKQAIEQTTGKVSKPKITLSDPHKTAKTIAEASADVDYLQQLVVTIELEIDELIQDKNKVASMPKAA